MNKYKILIPNTINGSKNRTTINDDGEMQVLW